MVPVPTNFSDSSLNETLVSATQIPLGEYIFRRINQLGVKSIFGVPGDFNLNLLEHLYSVNDLKWVGCLNELNSAYAADGYARYSHNLGVVVTTFGVGELSAINGISGAFAEYVPVLHIVGTSPTRDKGSSKQIHHLVPGRSSLHGPDHAVYENMVDGISCAKASLKNMDTAADEIDNLIQQIFYNSRPGYLFLPSDFADAVIDASNLNRPLSIVPQDVNESLTNEIAELVLNKLYQAENPVILGDVLTDRFSMTSILREFVEETQITNYSSFMGKSVLDESNESFIATYNGTESNPNVKESYEQADLFLHIGSFVNEINTGHYTMEIDESKLISFTHEYIQVGAKLYKGVNFVHVLPKILDKLETSRLNKQSFLSKRKEVQATLSETEGTIIEANTSNKTTEIYQSELLKRFNNFLKPNDVFVCETGSFMFGVPDMRFPKDLRYVSQGFYLSIGYALPACLGVGVAMKDFDPEERRLVLVEGDGSAQMTIQEFGTYLNQGIKPNVFLLNNSGYTVERIIKGPTRDYNDISPDWNWTQLFKAFGDLKNQAETERVETYQELDTVFSKLEKSDFKLRLFEVILDPMDVPWRFSYMCNRG